MIKPYQIPELRDPDRWSTPAYIAQEYSDNFLSVRQFVVLIVALVVCVVVAWYFSI